MEASRSTASGKFTPSVCITKSKMLPFLPEEKSNQAAFWSFTKKDGVFSLLNGESPFHSRPAFFSCTRRPTTSETGRRARRSSRNEAGNRMVIWGLSSQFYPISRRDWGRPAGTGLSRIFTGRSGDCLKPPTCRTGIGQIAASGRRAMKFRILASLGLLFLATPAFAQASKDLVGSWTLVSSTVQQGANTLQPFGADPKGALIFGADGRYVAMIARAGLPKFAGDNRLTGTPEEYKAIVNGAIAHFGSYVADETGHHVPHRHLDLSELGRHRAEARVQARGRHVELHGRRRLGRRRRRDAGVERAK